MKPWSVIAFHTDDDLYNGHIENLRLSLLRFGIKHRIETIPEQETWRETHLYMHTRIRAEMDRTTNNIVYLDADAIVRQYPVLFDTIEEDVAVHYKGGVEMLAGTTYIKNGDKGKQLMDEWAEASKKDTGSMSGQTGLATVLKTGKYSVFRLPAPYTLIFDSMKHQGPAVIEHFQASRKFKGKRG